MKVFIFCYFNEIVFKTTKLLNNTITITIK